MTGSFGGFLFGDRREAGRLLAAKLGELELADPVVVGLPRGGVPVAYEVAKALEAPLDIGLVRKLGAPGQPELGIGALGEDGTVILDRDAVAALGVGRERLEAIVASERVELERRRELYREGREPIEVRDREVVIVDDGLATGVTAAAAAAVMRSRGAARVVVAVPVCPASAGRRLASAFDELVCVERPRHFGGVGSWYRDFAQTRDGEVIELLRAGRELDSA
jgi:predicted phosphoribosyltransferase